jgi:hypothetical protein
MAPRQVRESSKVAISREPFRTGFDSERCMERICYQISLHPAVSAQSGENIPVSVTGSDLDSIRLRTYRLCEFHCIAGMGGDGKNFWIGYDSDES